MTIADEVAEAITSRLLEEIKADMHLTGIEADEVTCQMVADSAGVSYYKAARYLKRKEQAGEYASRKVRLANGKIAKAYKKAGR